MDDLSKTIEEYITHSDELALEIDGDWGIGKTYTIKRIFDEFDGRLKHREKRKHIYISVSGMQEKDIERQFYELIIANMPSDTKGVFSKLLSSISKMFSSFNLSFKGISIDLPLGLVAQKMESKIAKKYIYVIDDLERISDVQAMARLFGFISSVLQEKYESKVIVLLNEKEIDENMI